MEYRVLEGDARVRLKELEAESVHMILTSPPYGSIIQYSDSSDQIGFGQSLRQYYQSLYQVFTHCHRVLKPGCRMVINIGDEFVRSSGDQDFQVLPHHARILTMVVDIGFKYMGDIIWDKVTTSNANGGGKILGSIDRPRTAHHFINHEYILIFEKRGEKPSVPQGTVLASKFTLQQRQKWFRDRWTLKPVSGDKDHPAAFPLELAERLIQMYSYKGEIILDPFVGSGTTLVAAAKHDRLATGIELGFGPRWKKVIRSRCPMIEFN